MISVLPIAQLACAVRLGGRLLRTLVVVDSIDVVYIYQ